MQITTGELHNLNELILSCVNSTYEVWQWMVNKGFYSLSPASQAEISGAASIYNEVQQ